MKFIGFRISDDIHQALTEYCRIEGLTVTECLTKLVEGLLSEEGLTSAKPIGLESRVKALEGVVERLAKTEASPGPGGEGGMTKEEVRELVGEVLGERQEEQIPDIVVLIADQVEEAKAEIKQQAGELAKNISTMAPELQEAHSKLAKEVNSLKEQSQKHKVHVHTTAREMLACRACGPFFRDAVKLTNEELAERAQSQTGSKKSETEPKSPRRFLIMRPNPGAGFKWNQERVRYCKETVDQAEVEAARGRSDWQVVELG